MFVSIGHHGVCAHDSGNFCRDVKRNQKIVSIIKDDKLTLNDLQRFKEFQRKSRLECCHFDLQGNNYTDYKKEK